MFAKKEIIRNAVKLKGEWYNIAQPGSSGVSLAGVHNSVEAKLSHSNPEVTVLTPSAPPRVSSNPIVNSI